LICYRAKGTAHFEVSQQPADELLQALKQRLPGYLVPKQAREIAGADSKQY
jgi:L-lysine 2,3-aminomutase